MNPQGGWRSVFVVSLQEGTDGTGLLGSGPASIKEQVSSAGEHGSEQTPLLSHVPFSSF